MVAAGESVPSPESRSEQPVVARKRPNGDRREAHGEPGRTVCGQEVKAEFQSQWPWAVQSAAESVVRRKGTRIALYLKPDWSDLRFATKELAHDVQTPSICRCRSSDGLLGSSWVEQT